MKESIRSSPTFLLFTIYKHITHPLHYIFILQPFDKAQGGVSMGGLVLIGCERVKLSMDMMIAVNLDSFEQDTHHEDASIR